MKTKLSVLSLLAAAGVSCAPPTLPRPTIPSLDYTRALRNSGQIAPSDPAPIQSIRYAPMAPKGGAFLSPAIDESARGSVRFAADSGAPAAGADGSYTNLDSPGSGVSVYRSNTPQTRDYAGPLALGDPGQTASLWRESRSGNDLFRDVRAFSPMDLLTIIVSETSEGKKEADTEIKGKTTLAASIANFLGLEASVPESNPNIDPTALINATTQNDFKGEGETNRKGSLTAKISAMVVEVLPSGILRIEGEKIIAVNNEEQVMVISGLVRTRDVSSTNEVDSSKIANMRIDYYGQGTVGEAQYGGWASRLLRLLWPF